MISLESTPYAQRPGRPTFIAMNPRFRLAFGLGPVATALAAALAVGMPGAPVEAQGLGPSFGGAAAGALVGAGAALGASVAAARFGGAPVDNARDLVGWRVGVIAGGALSGVLIGATDRSALGSAAAAAGFTGALGLGVGALAGRQAWSDPAGPWSGAALGAGAGLAAGWLVGWLAGRDGGGERPPGAARAEGAITLSWSLPTGGLR